VTRGKVVLVPFPFDDLSAGKVRPAVCLTEEIGPYRHVVLAFISSRIPEDPEPSDMLLEADADGFSATGLRVSSVLRLHRLMTVTATFVTRELGSLPPQMLAQVNKRLRRLFALDQ
jgi:mRNA interferase MazF